MLKLRVKVPEIPGVFRSNTNSSFVQHKSTQIHFAQNVESTIENELIGREDVSAGIRTTRKPPIIKV